MKLRFNFRRNLPTVFSAIAAAGVVGTAVSASRDTIKSLTKETVIEKAKCYTPTAVIGFATIACIFGSDTINRRRQASLISAYAAVSKTFQHYQKKVIEKCGEEVHEEIMNEIKLEETNQEHRWAAGPYGFGYSEIVPSGLAEKDVERTFYDMRSKRYFVATLPDVLEAVWYFQRDLTLGACLTPNDWYERIGLPKIDGEDDVAWYVNDSWYWLDISLNLVVLPDDLEVIQIYMEYEPEPPE